MVSCDRAQGRAAEFGRSASLMQNELSILPFSYWSNIVLEPLTALGRSQGVAKTEV